METTSLIVIIGSVFTIFILLLAGAIIYVAHRKRTQLSLELQLSETIKRKEILETTIRTQELERERVGMELHDDLGPTFSAVKLGLETVGRQPDEKIHPELKSKVIRSVADLNEAIEKFSNISRLLYPVGLKQHGLKSALADIINRLEQESGISCSFVMDFEDEINPDLKRSVFRICSELLNNAVKHAQCTQLDISVVKKDNTTHISYNDNGVGFDREKVQKGIGLDSLHSRVLLHNGEMEIISKVGQGTQIKINLND